MVAKRRYVEPGLPYHVLNRGTNRQPLFLTAEDYNSFERLIAETLQRTSIEIFTYELMPNHWHFLVRATKKDALSEFFQYLSGTHSKRFRVDTDTIGEGHVYQDRFKSFPIEGNHHFLTVARYVERNARRAELVQRAEDWRWGGLWRRLNGFDEWLTSDWPVTRCRDWVTYVNEPMTESEMKAIRTSIHRGRPFGSPEWVEATAKAMGLDHTLKQPGRPRILVAH